MALLTGGHWLNDPSVWVLEASAHSNVRLATPPPHHQGQPQRNHRSRSLYYKLTFNNNKKSIMNLMRRICTF